MASAVGELSLSLQDSDDAARVAGFVGLIIFALTWREGFLLKQKNSWLSIFMLVLAIG